MVTGYIKFNILRIRRENLLKTKEFYTEICGMKYSMETCVDHTKYPFSWHDNSLHIFTYDKRGTSEATGVCFLIDDNFQTTHKNSGYWKIGFSLRDVNAAAECFRSHGYKVNNGEQFYDVGFLTSLSDPNGYSIELLQHDFESNFVKPMSNEGFLSQPMDLQSTIGQITIRCTDARRTCEFYQSVLGMKLLCIEQPANKLPFTLYFFAYTNDDPPSKELSGIDNREWLYKKGYCQIEIQHRHTLPKDFKYYVSDDNLENIKIGHLGFSVAVYRRLYEQIRLNANVVDAYEDFCFIKDPDGYVIQVISI